MQKNLLKTALFSKNSKARSKLFVTKPHNYRFWIKASISKQMYLPQKTFRLIKKTKFLTLKAEFLTQQVEFLTFMVKISRPLVKNLKIEVDLFLYKRPSVIRY